MVLGGHGDGAEEEAGEGGVAVEDVAALGVDVEEVEGWLLVFGEFGELGFDAAQQSFEDGGFEGVEEEGYAGGGGEVVGEGVLLEEVGGGEGWGGGVGGVGGQPVVQVALGDVGEFGVELDAYDLAEGELAGYQHGAAFAGSEVDEGVVVDGVGGWGLAPLGDEGAEDAGGYAVVGGDVLVVGVAGEEVGGGDEAAGVDSVGEVEGVDGLRGELEEVAGALAGDEDGFGVRSHRGLLIWMRLGLPSRPRRRRPAGVMRCGVQVGFWRRVTSVWRMVSRPARRFWIWAVSWALAASSCVVGTRVMATRNFGGTPGMVAPGASGSGVRVMVSTRPRSTMLQGRVGS